MARAFRLVKKTATFLIKGYRFFISPWLGNRCRYQPTCSEYTLTAIEQYGLASGTIMGAKRLCRCHPWSSGGYDPVPIQKPSKFGEV